MPPITPDEVKQRVQNSIPEGVFEAFNEAIARKYRSGRAVVLQKDVVALISEKMNVSDDAVFENHWLDVEDSYRQAGWKVNYDKPAYCENYEAFFEFERKPS